MKKLSKKKKLISALENCISLFNEIEKANGDLRAVPRGIRGLVEYRYNAKAAIAYANKPL